MLKSFLRSTDFTASFVVFFVALPLCLGIALASGAPIVSGIIAGVVGGIVVGLISGSHTSVSGPAAGLTVIVLTSIEQLHGFPIFLCALFLAGMIQLIAGLVGAGAIVNFIPSAVIKGMLAAIGIILIMKQFPHSVGYDAAFELDESLGQFPFSGVFSEIDSLLSNFTAGPVIVALVTCVVLLAGESAWLRQTRYLKMIPVSLLAVIAGTLTNIIFEKYLFSLRLNAEHLVNIPQVLKKGNMNHPDFSQWTSIMVWMVAIKIAVVASLETLLSIEATDKLDIQKRVTPANRELLAQGAGNMVSGILGGLPITAVIVRSSANILAGAKTKFSAVLHGILLALFVVACPNLLNKIPLSALAVLLIFVGFKLTKPALYIQHYRNGLNQFLPFIITIVSIILTDLLIGVGIGVLVSYLFVLRNGFQKNIVVTVSPNQVHMKLTGNITFLSKALIRTTFDQLAAGNSFFLDLTQAKNIDHDILELFDDLQAKATHRQIRFEKI
ncbi:MAG: SulP family inorganic anion transporter [Bacteroidota bacterium]